MRYSNKYGAPAVALVSAIALDIVCWGGLLFFAVHYYNCPLH